MYYIITDMRISVLSDLHLEFRPYEPSAVKADAIVLAGDIHVGIKGIEWAQQTFGDTPVIYVAGNHEYYRQSYPDHLQKMREAAKGTNVHFLENDTAEINGIVFLGCTLWTDFNLFGDSRFARIEAESKMNDYRLIRLSKDYRKLRASDTLSLNAESVDWLRHAARQHEGEKRIIVTHHAPSMLSVPKHYKEDIVSAAYASSLDELAMSLQAACWIHGHIHTAAHYSIGDTQVICNPRGYPQEMDHGFNPRLIIEV